jgi:hypothetical protein
MRRPIPARRVSGRLDSGSDRRVSFVAPVIAAGLIALLAALLPAAASALPNTGIKGRVTDSGTHVPISGAQVCVSAVLVSGKKCEPTESNGDYKIEGLEAEEYRVEFTAPQHEGQTRTITLKSGELAEGINAELKEVGEGAVVGRVTNASNGQGAGGVEVCPEGSKHCAETNGNGEYTLSSVPVGSQKLNFSPAEACEEEQGEKIRCQPKSNYLSGQSNSVTVKANQTITVNAALQVGGQISGTVTNASITHPGIAKIEVCATKVYGTEHEYEEYGRGGCAITNSSGQYTIPGLETGVYKVEFKGVICSIPKKGEEECPEVYVTQFYNDKPTHRQAQGIAVTAGLTAAGINASLYEAFPTTPASTAAPTLTGTSAVGDALTCSQGSWSHEPTYLLYQWTRNGTVISGQTGSTYTLQAADQGHSITCSVTAGNGAGAVIASSNTVAIPVPLSVLAGIKVKGAIASVTLRCPGPGACSGVLRILARVMTGRGRHRKTTKVTIGVASFSMAAGKRVTLHVLLTGQGRKLLTKARRRGLAVQIAGSGVLVHSAKLKPPPPKKKRR